MNRRNFVSSTIKSGAVVCTAACFSGLDKTIAGTLPPVTKETPCEEKVSFGQTWIKRFINNIDQELDEQTAKRLMELNGKACYLGSLEHRKIKPSDIPKQTPEEMVQNINKYAGEDAAELKDNVIEFRYVKNPKGLKVEDGYCLCPIVENGPAGLSGTYCNCSVGYEKEMFSLYLKSEVDVELLESLKKGGKTCRFKITIS